VHSLALQLAPILAAEKSKVPFYIVGGLLVLWALGLALGIGTLRPNFPTNSAGERLVIAITVLLVAGTLTAAVATSGSPAKTEPAAAAAPAVTQPTPEPATTPAATTPAPASAHASKVALSVPGPQLAYNTKLLTAKAGAVTVSMTNMSPIEHNVTIAEGSKVLGATPTFTGGTKSVTLNLKPGKYTFYCSVPGHRQAGMEGTLVVTAPKAATTPATRTPAKHAPAATTKHEPTPNATKVALSVPGPQLAYNTKMLSTKAGAVTISMTNMSPIEHNVTIAEGSKVLGATPTFTGGTKSVTLNLKPGKYTFYCSVPGHRQAGMEGTLVVK
jgi:plastocyanin